nr:hypothetical protein [Lachnospiraceae bacterium]
KRGSIKERGSGELLDKGPIKKLRELLSLVFTFLLVAFTWIPFLAGNIEDSGGIFLGIFKNFSPLSLIDGSVFKLGLGVKNLLIVVFAVFILFITDLCCERKKCRIDRLLDNTRPLIRWVFYYTLILLVLFSLNLSTTEFLYQSF